jgi:peroxiredoxin
MKQFALALMLTVLATAAEVPRKAPDVDITMPDGSKLNLEQYRGKVVCLAFILTT